jgi:cell division protein FtsZ
LAVAEDAGFFESFRIADDILRQGVQGISDIITIPGIINRDFADVKTIMARMGYAVMGTATACGAKRTIEAAQRAIASPLLEAGAIDGARGILINITGSTSLKLAEVQQACSIIQGAAHEDANIIFGAVMDEKMKDAVKITVIATGFREAPTTRHRQEVRTSFAAQHDEAMDFPEAFEPRDPMPEPPKHIMSEPDMSHEGLSDDRSFMDESTSSGAPASEQVAEAVSLDSMRTSVLSNMAANFEQDDLDVPAFLRKRNDVM